MNYKKIGFALAIVLLVASVAMIAVHPRVFAQWGAQNTYWQMGSGGWALNCPPNSCSIQGSVVNMPGLSGPSQLASNSAGSSTNTLVNSGLSFPIVASESGKLNCEFYFTNGSGGGLELSINGPGTPTLLNAYVSINTAAASSAFVNSTGSAWQPALGSTTSTVTTIQHAHLDAAIYNGTTGGTLNVQYADVNTTGTTTLLQGSWCTFP